MRNHGCVAGQVPSSHGYFTGPPTAFNRCHGNTTGTGGYPVRAEPPLPTTSAAPPHPPGAEIGLRARSPPRRPLQTSRSSSDFRSISLLHPHPSGRDSRVPKRPGPVPLTSHRPYQPHAQPRVVPGHLGCLVAHDQAPPPRRFPPNPAASATVPRSPAPGPAPAPEKASPQVRPRCAAPE